MRLRRTLRHLLQTDDCFSWREHLTMVKDILRREREIAALPISDESQGDVTAVLLSYARPQNIDAIVRSLLLTPSVGRVIISNNNPSVRIRQWMTIRHPRLTIIEQSERRGTPERYLIALKESSSFFLVVDDDLFLLPAQYEQLCIAVKEDPSRPHGMFGQILRPDGTFEHAVTGACEVDVLNRIYAFTHEHLERWYVLARRLSENSGPEFWRQNHWDDMVISLSGSARPLLQDVGPYLDCPTQGKKGTAVWREDEFFASREALYKRLRSITAP